MERRLFLQTLVASVVAAGSPLPVGFPKKEMYLTDVDYVWTKYGLGVVVTTEMTAKVVDYGFRSRALLETIDSHFWKLA